MERNKSPNKDQVVHRQIGGITSIRKPASDSSSSPRLVQRSIGGFTTVRRQIGGITSIRNNNRNVDASSSPSIQRPIEGFTTARTNDSGESGSSTVVRRQIGGFTSVRTNIAQPSTGGFSVNKKSKHNDANESNRNSESKNELDPDTRERKRPKISKSTTSTKDGPTTSSRLRNPRPRYHPIRFITWNCNGFSSRAKWNVDSMLELVTGHNSPDVICIQEARLKADGSERGRPLQDKDYPHIQKVLDGAFCDYTPFWSLADKKYAGTLTLLKSTVLPNAGSKANHRDGMYDPEFVAFTPSSAIDLILRHLGMTRDECGLQPETSIPPPIQKKPQQTSLKSFFAPKPKLATKTQKLQHHPEGRFQFFFFPGMDFVQTYVPNNGTKDESFARRRDWDETMLKFVRERKQILEVVSSKTSCKIQCDTNAIIIDSSLDRKLLWCGDMNVAATYRDGSHWESKESNDSPNEIYEWFRDEQKCLGNLEKSRKRPEHVGIPGFTPAERERFATFLQEGNFCDVWRQLHPQGAAAAEESSPWEGPNYTWRGAVAKNFDGVAKYQGKGQRIDYFLLSPKKEVETIENCDILGYGTYKQGKFCGSDHCVVEMNFQTS